MHPRVASLVLLGLGTLDVLALNLLLAPRLALLERGAPALQEMVSVTPAPEVSVAPHAEVGAAAPGARPAASTEPVRAASDIEFAQNSTYIERLAALRDLRRVTQELVSDADRQLLLRGHSDPLGPPRYNLELGRRRAEAVKRYLVSHGGPADRITVETVGSAELADPRPTPVAWARDRRVELLWR